MFEHGIPINSPGYSNDPSEYDCKTNDLEENSLHLHDLLSDTAKGRVAGPFKREKGVRYVAVFTPTGNVYKVPLFFAMRRCTHKGKRLQKKGRRVTDLTGNGLNSFANQDRRCVTNLPSMHFLMALLNKKSYLFTFDYNAAYRQLPYKCDC